MSRLALPLLSMLLALPGCSDPEAERAEALATIEARSGAGDLQGALAEARALRLAQPTSSAGWIAEALLLEDLWDVEGAAVAFLEGYRAEPEGFPRLPEMSYFLGFYPELTPLEARERTHQLIEAHAARYPAEASSIAEARVVGWTAHLNLEGLSAKQRRAAQVALIEALEAWQPLRGETSTERYHESEAQITLQRWDEARAAMAAGIAADTDTWEVLIQQMGLAFLELHAGEEASAWARMESYLERYAAWPGYHFAMRMPMVEFLQLTARVRYGRALPAPPALTGRPEAAAAAGVDAQFGTEDIRATIRALLQALETSDRAGALARAEELKILVRRDRGCVTETRIVNPHVLSLVALIEAELSEDPERSRARRDEALRYFPADPWLQAQATR